MLESVTRYRAISDIPESHQKKQKLFDHFKTYLDSGKASNSLLPIPLK